MPSMARRVVEKWIADQIEAELESLRDSDINGAGTVFATLVQVARLHESDVKLIKKEFNRTMARLRKSANLPHKWRDVHSALSDQA